MSEIRVSDGEFITGARVYDLEETLLASGYPMRTEPIDYNIAKSTEKDLKRCINLIHATETDNAAHGQFLSGILVSFDLTFTVKAWTEIERYRFVTFISSMSSMHKIAKFDMSNCFDEYVDDVIIRRVKELVDEYNNEQNPDIKKEKYLKLLKSCPTGLKLTARLTTNYRCIRNIRKQRCDHRLPEWRSVCRWFDKLPYANEFIIS